uniref:Uncharacterized protein n=1 Tax=viral metagenome TaxID=1070528 RepID=A0A6M3LPB7_9ZZZZ
MNLTEYGDIEATIGNAAYGQTALKMLLEEMLRDIIRLSERIGDLERRILLNDQEV